ncbi:uncharacterized protein LOC110689464 [Chenopodium quinoa]|uniref:uncharacterized protein LOC110689464 n=1 Tax=Chenopodium quinoa TaxID=63459 RepID=UPI000B782BE3|nr:uncharacterized protein LOC110689464 [Chenopodium quinoa]
MNEKDDGTIRRETLMDAFRETIDECGLRDLGYKGNIFTWKRGRTPYTMVRERLDRFLADSGWCSLFPNFFVRHLPREESDHTPIIVDTINYYERGIGGRKNHSTLKQYGYPMMGELRRWAAKSFGDTKNKIRLLESELQIAQGGSVDASMMSNCEKIIASELVEMRRLQESYWFARSRANEMRDGDKNTAYFHHKASARKKKNTIKGLVDRNGEWCTDENGIRAIVGNYFTELFSTSNPTEMEAALGGLERCVSEDMNNVLNVEPTKAEIKDA